VGHAVGTKSVPITFSWAAVGDAGSGVLRYEVRRWVNDAWAVVPLTTPRALSVRVSVPYGVATRFQVRAVDYAWNNGAWRTGPLFTPVIVRPTILAGTTYTRLKTWGWRTCTGCLQPKVRYSKSGGSRATLTMRGRAFAWVTVLGPTHGTARVRMDGSLLSVVSTHAGTIANRRVKAARSFGSLATHRFSVEVVGTRGHARVDIDAFIVLR
jgi:hypothetical protein